MNLETIGLDWSVRTEGLVTTSGLETDKIAVIRNDTNKIIGTHGSDYFPYQNSEMWELLNRLVETDGELTIHKGGIFNDGRKVYIQLKSADLDINYGTMKDTVKGFITGVNSFDGSTSFGFGNSNITISCQNKFWASYRQLTKVRHTKNMVLRIEDILKDIQKSKQDEQIIFENIKRMSETRFTEKQKEETIKTLFNLHKDVDLLSYNEVSTRTKNNIERFYIDLQNEINEKGDSVWGLFSGVTKYTTHSLTKNLENNDENKFFGVYGNRERTIFKDLLVMA